MYNCTAHLLTYVKICIYINDLSNCACVCSYMCICFLMFCWYLFYATRTRAIHNYYYCYYYYH